MAWPNNTRRFVSDLGSRARPTGGGSTIVDLPEVGILAGLWLVLTGSVAGTLSAQNALGFSSIVNRVRLTANAGLDLINVSGAGYAYLLRDLLEHYIDVVPANTGRTAITATTFNLGMFFPIAINARDPLGLIMLQNRQTKLQLIIDWLADASVATGATVTATLQPFLELFQVPLRDEDLRDSAGNSIFQYAHTITEESQVVSGAGDVKYDWPLGNIMLKLVHGAGIGASGSDAWSKVQVRVAQNQYLYTNITPGFADMEFSRFHGRARIAGVIPIDMVGTSGVGNYGSIRDAIDTSQLTDMSTIVTATGATTLYSLKEQLVPLAQQ